MKHYRILQTVCALSAALLLLAACSQNDTAADNALPEGEYPMTFTAAMDGLTATRVTTGNTWEGTEEVAMQIGEDVKKYKVASNGNLSSDAPFYWQSTTEEKTVSAWYPYTDTKPTTFTVQSDQSGTGYQASDLIYAASQTVLYSGNKNLTFKHLSVNVVANLKAGDGVTEDEVKNASVSIVNQALQSGTITNGTAADGTTVWNVEQVTPGSTIIAANELAAATGFQKSVQALLVPQQMMSKQFIRVTVGGNYYYYTPENATDANLEAGTQYTYAITVTKNGLTVTASGAAAWTGKGTGTEVTSKVPETGFAAADLKIGDYYYSDGSWSDGGYREYTDNTTATLPIMPVLTDASGNTRTVIGIVFWVGDATAKDETLKADHESCTHGLVVALKDASEGTTWQNPYTSVHSWLNSHTSGFLSVASDTDANAPLNNIQGYNNTKAIEAFNDANSGYVVQAVQKAVDYRNAAPAPATSSDWYLPSEKELTLLCRGDVDNIWDNNSGGTANRDLINSKLSSINSVATIISSAGYWSSTEYGDYDAFYVLFDYGGVYYNRKNYTYYSVRCVLAF